MLFVLLLAAVLVLAVWYWRRNRRVAWAFMAVAALLVVFFASGAVIGTDGGSPSRPITTHQP